MQHHTVYPEPSLFKVKCFGVSDKLPSSAVVTAGFCNYFDQLFDALNADSPDKLRGKPFSTNITKNSPHHKLFIEMRKFVSNMTYIGSKNKPPSQNGWIQTINATEKLWKNLQKLKITSLATRRLNQDPLENFFGCIRYSCGSNYNPTYQQFVAGVKTAIISNLRHSGRKKNCEDDTAVLANNFKNFLIAETPMKMSELEKSLEIEYKLEELEIIVADAVEEIDQATSESQACGYVSGFIFNKIRHNNCPECREAFLTDARDTIHLFTSFREYGCSESLNYCNTNFITCIEIMATLVNNYLKRDAWASQLKAKIMSQLEIVDFSFLEKCESHYENNIMFIKNSIFFICVKRFAILKNREIDEMDRQKSVERKMKILKNK